MSQSTTRIKDHSALASAKRAIRRNVNHLPAGKIFVLASLTQMMCFGDDDAWWFKSAQNAATLPEHHWHCDDPEVTKPTAGV